jgi:hypothetical protein
MARTTKYGQRLMLQGQAGVWAVASQLALRNIIPMFPGVDVGYDLILENGLKLQVRTSTLSITGPKKYEYCSYIFGLRRDSWYAAARRKRGEYAVTTPFSEIADYFVLWGIDENRFFIIPTSIETKSIYFPKRGFESCWTERKPTTKRLDSKLSRFEDRWDLLDVDQVVRSIEDSSVISNVPVQEELLKCR